MGRKLLVLAVLLVALGLVVAGCRKSGKSGGSGGYLPAPARHATTALA